MYPDNYLKTKQELFCTGRIRKGKYLYTKGRIIKYRKNAALLGTKNIYQTDGPKKKSPSTPRRRSQSRSPRNRLQFVMDDLSSPENGNEASGHSYTLTRTPESRISRPLTRSKTENLSRSRSRSTTGNRPRTHQSRSRTGNRSRTSSRSRSKQRQERQQEKDQRVRERTLTGQYNMEHNIAEASDTDQPSDEEIQFRMDDL